METDHELKYSYPIIFMIGDSVIDLYNFIYGVRRKQSSDFEVVSSGVSSEFPHRS